MSKLATELLAVFIPSAMIWLSGVKFRSRNQISDEGQWQVFQKPLKDSFVVFCARPGRERLSLWPSFLNSLAIANLVFGWITTLLFPSLNLIWRAFGILGVGFCIVFILGSIDAILVTLRRNRK